MPAKQGSHLVGMINAAADLSNHAVDLFFGGVPDDVRKHIRNVRKERLLALRACLDSAIARIEEKEKVEEERQKARKVEIE